MKKFHRALALFSASLIMSLHIVPAHAVEIEDPLTDVELYELEYERLLIEGNDDESAISLLSLDDENLDRTLTVVSGALKYYWYAVGNNISDVTSLVTPKMFTWQGGGSYRLESGNYNTASNARVNMTIGNLAGTAVDWSVPSVYVYEEGATLRFSGVVKTSYCGSWFNSQQFVGYSIAENLGSEIVVYPDRMAIVVNGDVVSSTASSGNGTFQFDYTFDMTETVTSVAYRFYFDNEYKAPMYMTNAEGISTRGLYFYIDDNAFAKYVVPDASTVVNKQILEQVKQIPATIYNFFFGDDGDEVAEGFKSEVDGVIGSGDVVREEFEELQKPDPADTIPDINVIIPQEEFQAYTTVFADVLQSKLVLPLMVMALSMALMAYVVYGKKG